METNGIANLSKAGTDADDRHSFIARFRLSSASAHRELMQFGFSDAVRVYLNGAPLYEGADLQGSRDYRFLGHVGFWDSVFLPLRKGVNDIAFVVTDETNGGTAAAARFEPGSPAKNSVTGVRLTPLLFALLACNCSLARASPIFVHVPQKIAPHVHLLHLPATYFTDPTGNVEVIEQSDGLILIDSGGYFGAGKRVVAMVKAISRKPVKALVLSHYHSDHSFGAPAILAAWPKAQFIASAGTYQAMAEGRPPGAPRHRSTEFEAQKMERMRKGFAQQAKEVAAVKDAWERAGWDGELATIDQRLSDIPGTYTIFPRRTFKHRLDFPDRTTPVQALFLGRANTPGDTLAWLPKQRILITGDIVVSPVPYMFDVFPAEMLAVFERMRALKPQMLIPGHGKVQDPAYLNLMAAMVAQVRSRVAALVTEKKSLEEIQEQMDGAAFRAKFVGEDRWLGFWFDNYTWAPLVESAYHEARGERLGPPPVTP